VVALDVPAWLDVVAGRALDADLPADLSAFPPANAGAPESPLPALVGATTMARLGLAPGQDGRLTLLGSTISIRAVEARASFPGLGSTEQLVVVDLAAARIALPAAELAPGLVFVRAPSSAAAALQRETDRYAPTVVMASREATLAEIRRAPLLEAVRGGFGAAVLLALIYVVAVVGVATRRATLARRRELAVLETLGLARRGVLRLLAVEVAPLVVTGLAAGVVVGLVIGALVVPELVPGTLGGLDGPTEIVADPVLLVSIGIAPVVAAAAALVLGARGMRGAELAQATRAVDA
jgi:predicted lysophospholipase L1 biosynthesis ABC-type transport system permease subunit